MKRSLMIPILVGSFLLLGNAAYAQEAHPNFVTALSGSNEVPARDTTAQGVAGVLFSQDGNSVYFNVTATDASTPIMAAHIHMGPAGQNGPVVVLFCSPTTKPCGTEGTVAQGTFTAADLTGPMQGMALSDLLTQIQAGNAYVNFHTSKFPDGEGRGQLVDLGAPSMMPLVTGVAGD